MRRSASTRPPVWQVGAVEDRVLLERDGADAVAAARARRARLVVDGVAAVGLAGQALAGRGTRRSIASDRTPVIAACRRVDLLVVERRRAGVGRELGRVQDLVGERAADAGDRPLVAQEARAAGADALPAPPRSAATSNAGSSGSGPRWASSACQPRPRQQPRPGPPLACRPRSCTQLDAVRRSRPPAPAERARPGATVELAGRHQVDAPGSARPASVKQQPLGPRGRRPRSGWPTSDATGGRSSSPSAKCADRHRRDRLGGRAGRAGRSRTLPARATRACPYVYAGCRSTSSRCAAGWPRAATRCTSRSSTPRASWSPSARRSRPADHAALGRQAAAGAAAAGGRRARRASGSTTRSSPSAAPRTSARPSTSRRWRAASRLAGLDPGAAAQHDGRRRRAGWPTTAPATTWASWPASAHAGWPLEGYRDPGPPVAAGGARAVARGGRADRRPMPTCVDGCGVVAFELPLASSAGVYARLPAEQPRQAGRDARPPGAGARRRAGSTPS